MLYPEQNEARLKLSLDGTWAFALGSCVEDQFDPAKPLPDAQPIAVPASYNDQNDQTTALRRHYGWAWYQRKVTLPTFCAGQRVVLRFGSVTHTAKVWLNGQLIAQHKGGFTPFEADVTALLHPGETVLLTVACDNRVNHSTLPVGNEDGQLAFFGSDNAGIPSVEAAKRAAAPQNRPNFDFFNYAGIHRPVWLYTTPKEYIEDVTVVPAVDGTVQYAVKTTGSAPVHVTVLDADGNAVASAEGAEGTITIPEVHLWEPKPGTPYLYTLMGVKEEKAIRNLLGYEDNTAGRIMTSEFVSLPATATVGDAIEAIRELDEDFESVYYVYTEDPSGMLTGVLSLRTLIVADRDATLGQLAYRDLVYVSPDEDQEDVTDEMTKYDLVAIPVCDENRHILGIVTFDDAMDVIAEEHQEDLQIAGVGSGDSASDDSTNVLSWFVHRQYWVVVWGIASCIMATVLGTALGSAHLVVFPMCAMPLVLLAASRMVSFVKNYFLEYDGHDDEPKPYLGFFFQSTGMGLILSLVTYLCAQLVRTAAFPDASMFEEQLFTGCFNIAAIICLVGNMSAVIYLMVLFWRDEHDLNTSGTAMNVIAVMISCVAYCAAAVLLTMSVMG